MSGPAAPLRRLLIPTVLALIGLAVLLALGTWQLERKAWKDALIDTLTRRLAAAPSGLPPQRQWASLAAIDAEFRPVAFRAELLNDREAVVFTSGSTLRAETSGSGYWVFTPARLPDGGLLIVNRGFGPQDRRDPATRAAGQLSGPVDIVGVMRWPEPRGIFTPGDDPARNVWYVRDQVAIAAAKGLSGVAPFYVEQEAPSPPGGLPGVGKLQANLPNNHLQYAITWYALGAVLVVVFAVFARSQRREGGRFAAHRT